MTSPDQVPTIIADRITGHHRVGTDGPFLKLDAHPSDDGQVITVDITRYDFTAEDRAVRIVLHVSPQMHLNTDPTPTGNGAVDPVIATPGSAT